MIIRCKLCKEKKGQMDGSLGEHVQNLLLVIVSFEPKNGQGVNPEEKENQCNLDLFYQHIYIDIDKFKHCHYDDGNFHQKHKVKPELKPIGRMNIFPLADLVNSSGGKRGFGVLDFLRKINIIHEQINQKREEIILTLTEFKFFIIFLPPSKSKMTTQTEQLQVLNSQLSLVKQMPPSKAEDQFYSLMEKAKEAFGEDHIYMGKFYFEYANFFIKKMEQNLDLFNVNAINNPEVQTIEEDGQENSPSEDGVKSEGFVEKKDVFYEGENILITEDKNTETVKKNENKVVNEQVNSQNKQGKQQQKQQQKKQGENQQKAEEDDDMEVCQTNLLCAIAIFQRQIQTFKQTNQAGLIPFEEMTKFALNAKSRLGDLYHLSQQYQAAIQTYRNVLAELQKSEGYESNRIVAQLHYLIAYCYLLENKEGCEDIAVRQYIIAVQVLLNHLKKQHPQDQTVYQIPTEEKVSVNRFSYLPRLGDSEDLKQLKETISCLLDKIEDTHSQKSIRGQYEEEKKKRKEEDQKYEFKEVSKDTPVVRLGTFGNRKRKPNTDIPESTDQ